MAAVEYKLIKNFFSKEELSLFEKYCYNKLDKNQSPSIDGVPRRSPREIGGAVRPF